MKTVFKYIIPCLAIAAAVVGCKDDDSSKAYIDSRYETGTTTLVSGTIAPVVADYQTATFSAQMNSYEDVVECGFEVATSQDFKGATAYKADIDSTANTFSATAADLEGSTTYYSRSYIITKAGGTVYGETQTFTTPKVPLYEINSTFLVHELKLNDDNEWVPQLDDDGNDTGYYLMSIEFVDEEKKDVLITGFLGFESEITGEWDEETQTLSVPAPQIVGEHPTYGSMFFRGINDEISGYTQVVTFKFTPLGGALNSSFYTLSVEAGNFGFYRFEAIPYEGGEEE